MVSRDGEAVIVDLHFREQFAMAQPTKRYRAALCITERFVGSVDRLTALVHFLCEEMAAAFTLRGLTLPPWRRKRAVLSKWRPVRDRTVDVMLGIPAALPASDAGAEPPGTSAGLGAWEALQDRSAPAEPSAPTGQQITDSPVDVGSRRQSNLNQLVSYYPPIRIAAIATASDEASTVTHF